ncbi:MAG TPA: NUDIX hydrolase [Conexibacter sp.]|jgi:8-oxo-dGTP pyrophosphatase MutT (NUDIX family)|nr:NUDIX hydrolase [Conexibacter sp.]
MSSRGRRRKRKAASAGDAGPSRAKRKPLRGGRRGDEQERSAGGVVVRGEEAIVIVPTRRGAQGQRVLALPKGHVDPGETPDQTALREVREETGVEARLVEKLGEVRYFYQREGKRIFKRVTFYLFAYSSGSLDDHDDEVEEARWMPLTEAAEALSYDGEREMAARALSAIVPDR